MTKGWHDCERCGARSPQAYYLSVPDPEEPRYVVNVRVCQKCFKEARQEVEA